LDRISASAGDTSETLYVTSGKWLRHLSLGYGGLLADLYWTRAVQYYGRERLSPHPRFELLGPLLRITTTLDPHLLVAYRFGAVFLAERPPGGAGHPQEAMQLLRHGIVANPGYWRLWEDLGFIEYWDLRDYPAAARIFKAGSERPGAEIWMKTLAAAVAAKGGELQTSWVLWSQIYRTAQNDSIRNSALEHLAAIRTLEEMQTLNRVLAAYQTKEGHAAKSFEDVVAAGFLRAAPRDPSGAPFVVDTDGKTHLGTASRINLRLLD
ncbi:MAG TPA: hypothetical protein VKV79_07075, partial [Terriglobia bacterium]|nr:hypothetical protein [Terriglobia bacterium]